MTASARQAVADVPPAAASPDSAKLPVPLVPRVPALLPCSLAIREAGVTDLASTQELVQRIRSGDERAREELLHRYVPALSRWAHGRLPHGARDLSETADLVQITLMKAITHLDGFEAQGPGAFLAWLRTIFLNVLKDELRRHDRRPHHGELQPETGEPVAPGMVSAMSAEDLASYESALALLPDELREAVVLSIEFGFSHEELANAIGAPSAEAARMRLKRALLKLAEKMGG